LSNSKRPSIGFWKSTKKLSVRESLQKKLEQKESEWHHLRGQIRQYERERVELREKLDRIIGQFAGLNLTD